jgi:hypothetical protein
MNKLRKFSFFAALAVLLASFAGSAFAQTKSSGLGDEFFVVSSVDRAHNALVLLLPTQIASSYQVTDKTQYFDENGKQLKLADLRAGDTLFVNYEKKSDGTFVVDRVRKGIMTVNELRRRYSPGLPPNAGQTSQLNSNPKASSPKSNNSTSNTTTKSGNTASSKTKSGNSKSTNAKGGATKSNSSPTTTPKPKQQTSH